MHLSFRASGGYGAPGHVGDWAGFTGPTVTVDAPAPWRALAVLVLLVLVIVLVAVVP